MDVVSMRHMARLTEWRQRILACRILDFPYLYRHNYTLFASTLQVFLQKAIAYVQMVSMPASRNMKA